jgi:hypothetical protein
MQALDLNLATRPFKNNTLLWTGYVSSCVLLVAFSVWNVLTWRESVNGLERLRNQVSNVEVKMSDLDRREARALRAIDSFDLKALEIQAAKANEVIEWKAFSWTRLFNLMEEVQPHNVRMISIRPLFRAGGRADQLGFNDKSTTETVPVAVEGLAKEFGHVRELQDALHNDPHFGRVMPQRMQRTERGEIIFQLTFLYHPYVQVESDEDVTEQLSAEAPAADGAQAGAEAEPVASAEEELPEPPSAEQTDEEEPLGGADEQGRVALAADGGPAAEGGPGDDAPAPGAADGGQPAATDPATQPAAQDAAAQDPADKQLQGAPSKPPRRPFRRPQRNDRQDEKKEKQEGQ